MLPVHLAHKARSAAQKHAEAVKGVAFHKTQQGRFLVRQRVRRAQQRQPGLVKEAVRAVRLAQLLQALCHSAALVLPLGDPQGAAVGFGKAGVLLLFLQKVVHHGAVQNQRLAGVAPDMLQGGHQAGGDKLPPLGAFQQGGCQHKVMGLHQLGQGAPVQGFGGAAGQVTQGGDLFQVPIQHILRHLGAVGGGGLRAPLRVILPQALLGVGSLQLIRSVAQEVQGNIFVAEHRTVAGGVIKLLQNFCDFFRGKTPAGVGKLLQGHQRVTFAFVGIFYGIFNRGIQGIVVGVVQTVGNLHPVVGVGAPGCQRHFAEGMRVDMPDIIMAVIAGFVVHSFPFAGRNAS